MRMSNKNVHIIQKQVLDITLPNASVAFDWEANKRYDFTTQLHRELEKCFDEYDKEGKHLIIEKLQLDLGIFTFEELNTEMPGRLYAVLSDTLKQYSNMAIETEVFSGNREQEYGHGQNKKDRLRTIRESKLEILCFFLKKGYLPWYGAAMAQWDEDWLKTLTENEINIFRNFLTAVDAEPIRRLTTQFDDRFIQSLLQRLGVTEETEKASQWLKRIWKVLLQEKISEAVQKDPLHRPFLSLPIVRARYWFGWIMQALGKGEKPSLSDLFRNHSEAFILFQSFFKDGSLEKAYSGLRDEAPLIWKEELNALKQRAKEANIINEQNKQGTHKKGLQQTEYTSDLLPDSIPNKQNKTTDNQEVQQTPESSLISKDMTGTNRDNKSKAEDDADALFINDAGLILLYPFLIQLFENCGWIDKKSFLNAYAQTMAVYALHYLATGEVAALEHRLVFPKLLAGIDWETSLEPVEPLNDTEKDACDELLKKVIDHWKALGNTSPDGLREAYLQRNGKLEHIYSGWHLTVEHKTLDILLNRLPWGISLIKLPWMAEMLTVTWE